MMTDSEITDKISLMRQFFCNGGTRSVAQRKVMIDRLYTSIQRHEQDIAEALAADLHKSDFESYATETGIVLHELKTLRRNMIKWSKSRHRGTPLSLFPSRSRIVREPYGVALVIAPWNYPFQLLFNPLAAAVAAGNCVALKTSPNAPATAALAETIVQEVFPPTWVSVFHGHRDVNQKLLAERFDYIFFTGSPALGRIVMEAAAKHLTPVTLELGGKSPCIVDEDADLTVAARRIVWGKCLNSGQTCIAPDYLMVHQSVKTAFLQAFKEAVRDLFGHNPQLSPDYPRIVTDKAMQRLTGYLNTGRIVVGGRFDLQDRYIEPTVIEEVPTDAPAMQEEIFGPIFPLIEFEQTDEVIDFINRREKPLALYYFTRNPEKAKKMLRETSSGGVCINDTVIHCANANIPFGGIGNSGMGRYHGKYGFDTFSHEKSVMRSPGKLDIKVKYPPYSGKLKMVKRLMCMVLLAGGLLAGTAGCNGCQRQNKVSLPQRTEEQKNEARNVNLKTVRYEQMLFSIDSKNLSESVRKLHGQVPEILIADNCWNNQTMMAGLKAYLSDPVIKEIYNATQKEFPDLDKEKQELDKAFGIYLSHFPDDTLPVVYTMMSGLDFNVPSVWGYGNDLFINLDMYLGKNYANYAKAGMPKYIAQRCERKFIATDCFTKAIAYRHMTDKTPVTALDYMIAEGKKLFLTQTMFPNTSPKDIIGYTDEQWKWITGHEAAAWQYLIQKNKLYSKEDKTIRQLVDETPFTRDFGNQSPGRVGCYFGWKIVQSYMQNHSGTTLLELMQNPEAQNILSESYYKPALR